MMISDCLARFKARGILLTCQDGRLRVDAPAGSLVVDDVDALRQWRDDILLYLERAPEVSHGNERNEESPPTSLLNPIKDERLVERSNDTIPPTPRHGWGTITLLWPATSKVPCPKGKWRRLEGGDVEATFTRQELRDALALAGVDVLALERGAEVADGGRR